jgi:hypothetical protein
MPQHEFHCSSRDRVNDDFPGYHPVDYYQQQQKEEVKALVQ